MKPAHPLRSLLVAVLLTLPLAADAETFYRLDMQDSQVSPKGIRQAGGKTFAFTREGGGRAAEFIRDPLRKSTVLRLRSDATPKGQKKDRAELTIHSGVDFGKPWFVGMQVFVPAKVQFSDTWHLFLQCHQAGTSLSPPISLNLDPDGSMALIARTDEDAFQTLWRGPFRKGAWQRLILEFQMGRKGYARLWVNDRKVSETFLPLRWQEGQDRCTLKTGIYRGPAATPFEMWFDDVALGSTYLSVKGW